MTRGSAAGARAAGLLSRVNARLARSLGYCAALGWREGALVAMRIAAMRAFRRPYVEIRVPGSPHRLRLRANSSDVRTFTQVFVERQYDISGFVHADRLVAALAASRTTIVDCGANVGVSAVWFATRFPNARIVAVEPERENFDLLVENTRRLPNVEPIRAAVWNTKTAVAIVNPGAHANAFRTKSVGAGGTDLAEVRGEAIPTVTIGELLDAEPGHRCVVKIDIEGAEAALFSTNTEWLEAADLVMIELHDQMLPWEGTSRSFFSAVGRLPFDHAWRGESFFCFRDPQAGAPVPA